MNLSCVFELCGVANQERSLGDYRRRSIVNTDILATFCLMNKFSEFVILILHQHSVLYLTGGYQKPSSTHFLLSVIGINVSRKPNLNSRNP